MVGEPCAPGTSGGGETQAPSFIGGAFWRSDG